MTTIERKWRCGSCGELHDFEDNAIECCPPEVTEVYLCPVCAEAHYDETEAIECCDSGAEAEPPSEHRFPKNAEDTAAYIAEFCALNNLKE